MAKDRSLTAEPRSETRKGAARRLRRAGMIPAVMYGHRDPVLLSIDALEFSRKFQHISESTIIQLAAGTDTYDVLVKDFQMDTLRDRLVHIDFFEIERGKQLRTRVLLHFEGNPIGVREGGLLEQLLHEVEIEALPKDLPERINISINDLDIGHSLHISDIETPEGVRLLNSPEQVVVLVAHKTEEEEEVEDELGEDALLEGEEEDDEETED